MELNMSKIKVRYLNYIICDYCRGIISNPHRKQKYCKFDKYAHKEYTGCDAKAARKNQLIMGRKGQTRYRCSGCNETVFILQRTC